MALITGFVKRFRSLKGEEVCTLKTRKSRKTRATSYQATYDAFLGRLVAAREEANLTPREVSAKMGMSHSFLSKCETGDRRVDVIEFLQLAKLYSKPLAFFLIEQ